MKKAILIFGLILSCCQLAGAQIAHTEWYGENENLTQRIVFIADDELIIIQAFKESGKKYFIPADYALSGAELTITTKGYIFADRERAEEKIVTFKASFEKDGTLLYGPLSLRRVENNNKLYSMSRVYTPADKDFEHEEGFEFGQDNRLAFYYYNNNLGVTFVLKPYAYYLYAFDGEDGIIRTGEDSYSCFTVNGDSLYFYQGTHYFTYTQVSLFKHFITQDHYDQWLQAGDNSGKLAGTRWTYKYYTRTIAPEYGIFEETTFENTSTIDFRNDNKVWEFNYFDLDGGNINKHGTYVFDGSAVVVQYGGESYFFVLDGNKLTCRDGRVFERVLKN